MTERAASESGRSEPSRFAAAGPLPLGALWGAVAATLVLLSPWVAGWTRGLPPCVLKAMTGIPCPGCGTVRTAIALSHVDLSAAFALNPLAAVALLALVGGGLIAGVLAALGREIPRPTSYPTWVRLLAAGLILGNWAFILGAGRV